MSPNHLYFIQCDGERGPIKIGITSDPPRRIRALQIGCPARLEYLLVLGPYPPESDMAAFEQRLHTRFAEHRISGEWFWANDRLLSFISCARGTQEDDDENETEAQKRGES